MLSALIHSQDPDVLTDALWALSYLSDGDSDRLSAVLEANVVARVVELLVHPHVSLWRGCEGEERRERARRC